MTQANQNPKIIVKNGILLASRFFLSLLLSFYTTRLTLSVLGDIDFGINNVIGGVISMFAVISMPITNSLQRFFNVEFARQKIKESLVFSTAFRLVVYLILGMLVCYETVGLYVVTNVLDYPVIRASAVVWTFQITAIITLLSFINMPFSAFLYSKEIMSVPASVELLGNVLKLVFLLLIPFGKGDMLILFTTCLLLIYLVQFLIYFCTFRLKCPNVKLTRTFDGNLLRDMLHFSGWNSIESFAGICITYLTNIFVNVFGGVLCNTANGLAKSVSNAVNSFSLNVLKAIEPQVTSATVLHNNKYRDELVILSVKLALCIVCLVSVIFWYDGSILLKVWLGKKPLFAFDFCKLMLLTCIFSTIVLPLRSMIIATGRIKAYFSLYGIISVVALLLMYILLSLNYPVIIAVYVYVLCSLLNMLNAIGCAYKVAGLPLKRFAKEVLRVVIVLFMLVFIYSFAKYYMQDSLVNAVLRFVFSSIFMGTFFLFIGLNSLERRKSYSKLKMTFIKYKRR